MLDFLLMLQAKLPVVDTIQPQSNKSATGVEKKATAQWIISIFLNNFSSYPNVNIEPRSQSDNSCALVLGKESL